MNLKNIEKLYIYLMLALVVVILYIWYTQTKIQSLKNDLNIKSDEQVLVENISLTNKTLEVKKWAIKRLQDEIIIDEALYNCYKTQLLRLADNIEYSIEYCNWDNLEQFKGLK